MTEQEYIAVTYHDIFKFQLSAEELNRWNAGPKLKVNQKFKSRLKQKLVLKQNQNLSEDAKYKLKIARDASLLLSKIPSVLFVGITGSLAMNNAKSDSDIDLLVITKANFLWPSRILSLLLLKMKGFKIRKARDANEKNKLCLNLWLDESSLDLPSMPHNAYSAHELSQVVPLVQKNNIYANLISQNKWILGYWPNAISQTLSSDSSNLKAESANTLFEFVLISINIVFFVVQLLYMKPKMTRESVTLSSAFFHPFDWGEIVMKKIRTKGVFEIL